MNKQSFLTLIEKMVEKEVKKQLPILLHELLSKEITTQELGDTSEVEEVKKQYIPPTPKVQKQYTKNEMLNKILNETVNDLSLRESGRIPSVALDGNLEMSNIENLNESISYSSLKTTPEPIGEIPMSILDLKGKSAEVDKLMKFDFKNILKKSMQKSSERMGK